MPAKYKKGDVMDDGTFLVTRKIGPGTRDSEVRIGLPAFKGLKRGKSVRVVIAKDGKTFTGEVF